MLRISGDQPHLPIDPSRQADAQASQPPRVGNPNSGAAAEDRVELSSGAKERARETQLARQAVEQTPEDREAMVAELKQAVENGTYNVKAEQIAAKLVRGTLLDQLI